MLPRQLFNSVAVQILCNGSGPPAGFVRRSRPVYPEFVIHCNWWPVQYHEKISEAEKDQVWLWIPKKDNVAYQRGDGYGQRHIVHERRWCEARIKITGLQRGATRWFSVRVYFTVVSSIHSVLQAYPSRRITYKRQRRGDRAGVIVRRTQ